MDGLSGHMGDIFRHDWTSVVPGSPYMAGANQTFPYNQYPAPNIYQQVVGQATVSSRADHTHPLLNPGPTYNINVIIVAGQDAERIQVNDSLKEAISKAVIEALQVAEDKDTLDAFTQD